MAACGRLGGTKARSIVALTHIAVVTARKRLCAPARSAAAPRIGESNAVRIPLNATARDHHVVPVNTSGAIACVK
ncbi:MAG: hypothetical protein HW394_1592 [Acidobacteria bacterium]|nr:hypothetical protein [Acidobacteriota bacterium]